MTKMRVKLTFTEEVLGTMSSNPEIHREYIASKGPNAQTIEEEIAARGEEDVVENTMTIFPRTVSGGPMLWDYQIKGFLKDACSMLARATGTKSSKLTAHKKIIDGLVFVTPRKIPLVMPEGGEVGECQRPLRAQTAQGERIALAHSETIPAGTSIDIEIEVFDLKKEGVVLSDCLREWLDYGSKRGIGQWRNSGKGTFTWEELA